MREEKSMSNEKWRVRCSRTGAGAIAGPAQLDQPGADMLRQLNRFGFQVGMPSLSRHRRPAVSLSQNARAGPRGAAGLGAESAERTHRRMGRLSSQSDSLQVDDLSRAAAYNLG
jgi:hypothetical protein